MIADSLGINLPIIVIDKRHSLGANGRSLAAALKIKADALFCLDQNDYSYILSSLMRARKKIGFYQSIDLLYQQGSGFVEVKSNSFLIEHLARVIFRPKMLRRPTELHESDVELALLQEDAPDAVRPYRQGLRPPVKPAASPSSSSASPYVYISTQSRWTARSLSASQTIEMIEYIRKAPPDYSVYYADGDPSLTPHFSDPRVRPYQNTADLRDFRDFIQNAAFVISIDSFPVHMASFCNTPVLALFGPAPALRFEPTSSIKEIIYNQPQCSPCVQRVGSEPCQIGLNRCLAFDAIDTGQIAEAIERLREAIHRQPTLLSAG